LDEASLHEFVHSTYPRLVAAVALITGSRAAAEDAIQEALARAWERSARGERIDSLPAWVTTVSMNRARSGLRRLRAQRKARAALIPPTATDETSDRADLARALRALPRRQREAIVLHYYLGLGIAEIAAVMRAPEGTVKSLLFRGRASLARTLGVDEGEVIER
jgi:RNA polymerase sigma-70 factor (ECF subfamily)